MKKWKEITKFVLFFSFPIIFQFLGQASLVDKILIPFSYSQEQVKTLRDFFYLIGIIFTFLPLGTTYLAYLNSNSEYMYERKFLFTQLKIYLMAAIRGLSPKTTVNIRIFTPKWPMLNKIGMRSIKFRMRNVDGFTDDYIKGGLEFQVFPVPQGLVGECYHDKRMVFDSNLQTSPKNYNLNEYQKAKTYETKFCSCVPIFSKNEKVIAIISFDSHYEINMTQGKQNKMFSMFYKFSNEIGGNMKSLFK